MSIKERGLITCSCSKDKSGVLIINSILQELRNAMVIEDSYMFSMGSDTDTVAYYITYTASRDLDIESILRSRRVLDSIVNKTKLDYRSDISIENFLDGVYSVNDVICSADLCIISLNCETLKFKVKASSGECTDRKPEINFCDIDSFRLADVRYLIDKCNDGISINSLISGESDCCIPLTTLTTLRSIMQLADLSAKDYKYLLNKANQHFTV